MKSPYLYTDGLTIDDINCWLSNCKTHKVWFTSTDQSGFDKQVESYSLKCEFEVYKYLGID